MEIRCTEMINKNDKNYQRRMAFAALIKTGYIERILHMGENEGFIVNILPSGTKKFWKFVIADDIVSACNRRYCLSRMQLI